MLYLAAHLGRVPRGNRHQGSTEHDDSGKFPPNAEHEKEVDVRVFAVLSGRDGSIQARGDEIAALASLDSANESFGNGQSGPRRADIAVSSGEARAIESPAGSLARSNQTRLLRPGRKPRRVSGHHTATAA